MLERYILKAKIPISRVLFLFRPIVAGKIPKLRESGQLSRTRLSELLKEKLDQLGFPTALTASEQEEQQQLLMLGSRIASSSAMEGGSPKMLRTDT